MCFKDWKKLKPWARDGIIGAVVGVILYALRVGGVTIPYLSDWNSANLSLGVVGVTMVVAYAVAGVFIGELIAQTTGKRRK
ncbi:MAG: hypothetical protein J7K73_00725 [Nanoarchaeota archaeon]|nr:hypothetical protein [Nanoarchaeota archaeon]